jgi:hypothetical protein
MKQLIAFALVGVLCAACQETLEEKAAKEAELYTKKNCPAKIAENITMDSLTFELPTHTLHYYYTLSGIIDSIGLLNPETARSSLLKELRNTTSMLGYKEAGYRFAYTYRSQKDPDTVLFDMVFTEKDYNGKEPE